MYIIYSVLCGLHLRTVQFCLEFFSCFFIVCWPIDYLMSVIVITIFCTYVIHYLVNYIGIIFKISRNSNTSYYLLLSLWNIPSPYIVCFISLQENFRFCLILFLQITYSNKIIYYSKTAKWKITTLFFQVLKSWFTIDYMPETGPLLEDIPPENEFIPSYLFAETEVSFTGKFCTCC